MDLVAIFCVSRNKTNDNLVCLNVGSKLKGRKLNKNFVVCNYDKVISKNPFFLNKD